MSQFRDFIGRGNLSQSEAASRLRLMKKLTRISLSILIGIFLGAVLNVTVMPVRAQSGTDQQLMNIMSDAAQSLGWSEEVRWGYTIWGEVTGAVIHYNCSENCGGAYRYFEYIAVSKRYSSANEATNAAKKPLLDYFGNFAPIPFHAYTIYHGHIDRSEDLIQWAMGDVVVFIWASTDIESYADGMPVAEAVYASAVNHGLGLDVNPNPNPNPEPNPSPIDPETIRILQSILGTPILPITGAIAGGLIAWLISMLDGGRTALPLPSRPPTGGLRPGQVGPDGKVWSSQGWISKSTYDYQQKWLQKGWRLDPKTNKLEVQPGAVNDSGQVWYKLPYDEGNSHYWVDQAKFQECEKNMAQGLVYDHGLSGWVKSSQAADFNRSKQDFYDKVSSPESRQQDHERLMQQQVSQDPQYQKIADDIQKMEDEFNKWRSDSIKGDMDYEQKKMAGAVERMETMDRWGNRAEMAEAGADVFISVAATLTGPVGKSIEEGYNTIKRTALAVDTGVAKKSIKAAVVDYGKRYVKDKVVESVSSLASIDKVSRVPGKIFKKVASYTGKPGIKVFSKTRLKAGGAIVDYGKSKVVEGVYGDGEIVEATEGAGIDEYFNAMLHP